MDIVIADDLTGASELAGIGFRYGLNVELTTRPVAASNADLLVVCTDSRSMPGNEAIRVTTDALNSVLALQPRLLYKKIDSVLRGHIVKEIKTQMELSGVHRALIVPANPSMGRTIRGGHYYINEEPVNKTSFAADPEFAISDSSVLAMLHDEAAAVQVLTPAGDIPANGIFIGEAATSADIDKWVTKVKPETLLAGAGDFFTALLDNKYKNRQQPRSSPSRPYLYVSGTAFGKSVAFIKSVSGKTGCVVYLPANEEEEWMIQVHKIIRTQNRLVIAFDNDELAARKIPAVSLRLIMARIVKQVVEKENIKEIFIEGGSTAAEILRELGITTLSPVDEWQRGVVRMKAGDMYITLKPGSYDLPMQVKAVFGEQLSIIPNS